MTSAGHELERTLAALASRTSEILGLTEQLVRINSYSANVRGNNDVAAVLRAALASLPLEVEVAPGAGTGDHLVFSTEAAAQAAPILLIGHHDTVYPPGMFETYSVEADIARGPGVLDMKGALALVVVCLRCLDDAGLLSKLPLRFISVADEEIGSPSSRDMLQRHAQSARAGLVFEAGRAGDAIITARRGSGHALATAHGRAAHAGNALSSGRNAIWALSKFIDRAQTRTDEARGTSVNVGLVSGGSARNTVPDLARCELDLRFGDADGERDLSVALRDDARLAQEAVPDTRIDLDVHVSRKPWMRSDDNAALCARYADSQREAGLHAAEAKRMGGGSDANTVAAVGLPVIDGLGPRGSGFHTLDEHISIASLPLKAEALLRFLLSELRPST